MIIILWLGAVVVENVAVWDNLLMQILDLTAMLMRQNCHQKSLKTY
jgi:hypothetical protein